MSIPGLQPETLLSFLAKVVGSSLKFVIDTDKAPLYGGEYVIYALETLDSSRKLCVRMPRAPHGPHTSLRVQKEAEILGSINTADIDLFQPLLASDHTFDNLLRTPYLLLGWVDGKPLKWAESRPFDTAARSKILETLANASIDLLRVSEAGPSALDWITHKIDRKVARAQANKFSGTVSQCEDQRNLVSKYWMPELDAAPHVLVHNDLSPNNIIVDNNSKVQGIIDLGWAELQPLQFAAEYPRFLTYEPMVNDSGQFEWSMQLSAQMARDRALYLSYIKARAGRDGGIAEDYYRVLSRKDEVSRYWWYVAASRIDVHKAMVSCEWDPPMIDDCRNDVAEESA